MNRRVGGSIPSSSCPHDEVTLGKTLNPPYGQANNHQVNERGRRGCDPHGFLLEEEVCKIQAKWTPTDSCNWTQGQQTPN